MAGCTLLWRRWLPAWRILTNLNIMEFIMGDKGGKKDKDKVKKQADKKHDDKDKAAKEKQPKQKPKP